MGWLHSIFKLCNSIFDLSFLINLNLILLRHFWKQSIDLLQYKLLPRSNLHWWPPLHNGHFFRPTVHALVLDWPFHCQSGWWSFVRGLTFESADKILWCDHSNESSLPVIAHGAICFSKFYKNNEIWTFRWNLLEAKFGSDRVKLVCNGHFLLFPRWPLRRQVQLYYNILLLPLLLIIIMYIFIIIIIIYPVLTLQFKFSVTTCMYENRRITMPRGLQVVCNILQSADWNVMSKKRCLTCTAIHLVAKLFFF